MFCYVWTGNEKFLYQLHLDEKSIDVVESWLFNFELPIYLANVSRIDLNFGFTDLGTQIKTISV